MQPQLIHEHVGDTPQEGSKKGPQGAVGLHLPWHRSVSRDHLLLMISAVQLALFVPLAWWAHKHPQPPVEIGITHVLQKKQPRSLQFATRVLSTIAGSAVLLNILVVPTPTGCATR